MNTGPSFRYDFQRSFKLKGVKYSRKESIMDGEEKGLTFNLTKKNGEKFYRINVKEISKDKFEVKEKVDEKETTKEVDMAELKKMLKTNNELEFVKLYVDKERGTYKGGADKDKETKGVSSKDSKKVVETKGVSSKDSKKVVETKGVSSKDSKKVVETKGGAKKTSKKASKKTATKKTSKTATKKTSKTATKKTSKKASKKTSKKASKKY